MAKGIGAAASGIKDRIGHALTPQAISLPNLVLGLVLYCPGAAQSITPWPRERRVRSSLRYYSVLMVTVMV